VGVDPADEVAQGGVSDVVPRHGVVAGHEVDHLGVAVAPVEPVEPVAFVDGDVRGAGHLPEPERVRIRLANRTVVQRLAFAAQHEHRRVAVVADRRAAAEQAVADRSQAGHQRLVGRVRARAPVQGEEVAVEDVFPSVGDVEVGTEPPGGRETPVAMSNRGSRPPRGSWP
jgi:hypothetical protein